MWSEKMESETLKKNFKSIKEIFGAYNVAYLRESCLSYYYIFFKKEEDRDKALDLIAKYKKKIEEKGQAENSLYYFSIYEDYLNEFEEKYRLFTEEVK